MTQLAKAYARGLYDLAKADGLTRQILDEMTVLDTAFREARAILPPFIPAGVKQIVAAVPLDDSFRSKVHPYVLNFLKILTERGEIACIFACCQAYRSFYNADEGILPVSVVTAMPLTPAQTEKLRAKLTAITGKTVELTIRIDPACLGGICLDYDGKRYDGTVKNQLARIAAVLKNTV